VTNLTKRVCKADLRRSSRATTGHYRCTSGVGTMIQINVFEDTALNRGDELRQTGRVEDSHEVAGLEFYEAAALQLRGGTADAFEREPEETGDVRT